MEAFDKFAEDYDVTLNSGLRITGEGKRYFAVGRIRRTAARMADLGRRSSSILDYGCGTGESAAILAAELKAGRVIGVDTSTTSLEVARRRFQSNVVRFRDLAELPSLEPFDVAYVNGVLHHVPLPERSSVMRQLANSLRKGGLLALWENNPYNPGTRWVMRRLPFDADAIMLSAREARRLAHAAGLDVLATEYCFFFPRSLSVFRSLEPRLRGLPFGGQYLVLASKPQ